MNQAENYAKLPPHKRAEVEALNEKRERAAAIARGELEPAMRPKTPMPKIDLPDERIAAGSGHVIQKGCRSLFAESLAFPTNRWSMREVGSTAALVCGGASPQDPKQGGVMVTLWEGTRKRAALDSVGNGPWFPTPSANGTVRVLTAVADTLHLLAADGTSFYFDVSRLQYVERPD